MANITNYKCPACTGPLHYVGSSDKLECDYCGSKFDIAEIDKLYSENVESSVQSDFTSPQVNEWDSSTVMKSYNCPSCGAELICEETTVATSCPYCGNPTVIASQFKGGQMPEYVIPFKIDKKGAIQGLKNYYKGKIFLPNVFSAENHIEEIKGVYVPFWLFSGNVDAKIEFNATEVNSHRSGDYMVTTTKHYDVDRSCIVPYDKIPVDASVKMDDAQMDSLEPFDYSELKEFTASYLPGYLAESFDVTSEECFERCKARAENTAYSTILGDLAGYSSVYPKSKKFTIQNEQSSYAFLPVWLLSTKWKDKNYLFAMNGQTGKFIGDLPIDKGKKNRYFWKIALISTAIITVILSLFV